MKAAHNVLYTKNDIQTHVSYPASGVDLEVEGVRYIEMNRGPHMYWARLLQGAEISNKRAESMCPCENMT